MSRRRQYPTDAFSESGGGATSSSYAPPATHYEPLPSSSIPVSGPSLFTPGTTNPTPQTQSPPTPGLYNPGPPPVGSARIFTPNSTTTHVPIHSATHNSVSGIPPPSASIQRPPTENKSSFSFNSVQPINTNASLPPVSSPLQPPPSQHIMGGPPGQSTPPPAGGVNYSSGGPPPTSGAPPPTSGAPPPTSGAPPPAGGARRLYATGLVDAESGSQPQLQAPPLYPQQQHHQQQPQGSNRASPAAFSYSHSVDPNRASGLAPEAFTIDPKAICPSKYLKTTIGSAPSSSSLLTKCSIPFGCIVHPLAKPETPEEQIPIVNFGPAGIVRCRRCRAYINPFVRFSDVGRKWRCNFCDLMNEVPPEYFSALDENSIRKDINERPELTRGCVEFVAPSDYMVRPPQPPVYFFLFDVSYYAVASGMLRTAVQAIQQVIPKLAQDTRTHIGFLAYDRCLHFVNLRSGQSQPQLLVVSDFEEGFLPVSYSLLVNLSESKNLVEELLQKLPDMFGDTKIVESALGPALRASFNIMKPIGGKLLLFQCANPTVEPGKLSNRNDPKLVGTEKEHTMLQPVDNFYKNFALDCSNRQISIDVYMFASTQIIDVPTLGSLSQYTGGELNYYPLGTLDCQPDCEKFSHDIARNLTRETGFEAVMRLRVSAGVRVNAYYGNFFIRSTDLLALPNIDADKAFGIDFSISDSLVNIKNISIQAALLYTTSSGDRRIRTLTTCLPVTSSLADLYKTSDIDAIMNLTSKACIEKGLSTKLRDSNELVLSRCIDMLSVYRSSFATNVTSQTHLVLPDSLKKLPLYTLALIKNLVVRVGAPGEILIRPSERSGLISRLRTLPVHATIPFIYPRLYLLSDGSNHWGVPDNTGKIILPTQINLTAEKLDANSVVLLDDGQVLLLRFARNVSSEWFSQLFGNADFKDCRKLSLPNLQTDLSQRLNSVIQSIRSQNTWTYQRLFVIREGEPYDHKLITCLVEDRTREFSSYHEFLIQLQTQITSRSRAH